MTNKQAILGLKGIKLVLSEGYPFWGRKDTAEVLDKAIKALEGQKTGEWENDEHDMPRCSECGYITEYNKYIDDYYYSDWCPNCGAKMEVEK